MIAKPKQRPEALAQFAETARSEKRKDRPGLVADQATAPIPTDSKAKDDAATKVLQEGATGEDHGAEAAIDRLPDRILESRHEAKALNHERELQQLRDVQLSEGEDEVELDETDIDVTLEEDDEMADSGLLDRQTPAKMNSHEDDYSDEDDPGKV